MEVPEILSFLEQTVPASGRLHFPVLLSALTVLHLTLLGKLAQSHSLELGSENACSDFFI